MSASNYVRGGTLYNQIESQLGTAAADQAWHDAIAAERNGANVDGVWRTNETLALQGKNSAPLDDSTFSLFTDQIFNDPLAAPAESLNNQLQKAVGNVFKNPFVLLAFIAVGVGVFLYFGGAKLFKK